MTSKEENSTSNNIFIIKIRIKITNNVDNVESGCYNIICKAEEKKPTKK